MDMILDRIVCVRMLEVGFWWLEIIVKTKLQTTEMRYTIVWSSRHAYVSTRINISCVRRNSRVCIFRTRHTIVWYETHGHVLCLRLHAHIEFYACTCVFNLEAHVHAYEWKTHHHVYIWKI